MIGDVILWIKKVLKRNSCFYDYKTQFSKEGDKLKNSNIEYWRMLN